MLQIGLLQPDDLPAALALSTQAGWNQLEQDWARLLALWPENCLAGRVDGRVVATATLAVYPPGVGWVGMVLVDVEHRGRGHGGAMMDAVLAAADRHGIRSVGLDATDLGRPVYVKRGFVDAVGIDRRVLAATDRPRDESSAEPLRDADWAALLELDRDLFGANRSRLLARLRDEPGAACRVVREGRDLIGYGLRRPGRGPEQIGPVVARSADAAARVIGSLAAGGDPSRGVQLDAFRGGALDAWLDDAPFVVTRRLTRMFRGHGNPPVASHGHTFAAAGFELG